MAIGMWRLALQKPSWNMGEGAEMESKRWTFGNEKNAERIRQKRGTGAQWCSSMGKDAKRGVKWMVRQNSSLWYMKFS